MSAKKKHNFDRIALVLQGGGSRGAYHMGVYQALHEAGYIPDTFCGISIGALTACVLAGNEPHNRLDQLHKFWDEISRPSLLDNDLFNASEQLRAMHNKMSFMQGAVMGQPHFFKPWFPIPNLQPKGSSGATSYFDTSPMKDTLSEFANFDLFNKSHKSRLITGATRIKTGELVFFDSQEKVLKPEHVLASGSLPPGFPGMHIDNELYWDGGAVSNSAIEGIFRIQPAVNTLIFMIDLFNGANQDPQDMDEVSWLSTKLMYASRTSHNINQYAQKHNLKKAINHLLKQIPASDKDDPIIKEIAKFASDVNYHIVHIIYNEPKSDTMTSGSDFSRMSIRDRAQHGYEDTQSALEQADWLKPHDEHIGARVHRYVNNVNRK